MKEPQLPKKDSRIPRNTALALASVGIAATAYLLKASEHQIDGYLNPVIFIIIPNVVSTSIAIRKLIKSMRMPLNRETQKMKNSLSNEGGREVFINLTSIAAMNLLAELFK